MVFSQLVMDLKTEKISGKLKTHGDKDGVKLVILDFQEMMLLVQENAEFLLLLHILQFD